MVNIFNFNYLNSFNSFSYIELIFYSITLLCIGSFASSIIFRLSSNLINNNKLTIYSPRSFCPNCNKSIKLINLLPVFGFLFQKGKCRSCKKNISPNQNELSNNKICSWTEVECLGACVNAPMMQVNEDYFEDLDEKSAEQIIKKLTNNEYPSPGSAKNRKSNAPENGKTTLIEVKNA